MNWLGFAILAWFLLGLELGLKPALGLGPAGIAPSFVFPLLTLVAMSAPPAIVHWACLSLGVMLDLTFPIELRDGKPPIVLLGPYALGSLLAGQLIVTMRGLMIRRNPLTLAFLCTCGYAVCQVVVVAIFTLRHATGTPLLWDAPEQLLARLGSALYTGVLALVMALALVPAAPWLGLHAAAPRRFATRRS
ncbi:MAG: hypothetical protein SFZ23_08905 [Planctomycetota bacterium]|nr:hypothetical protein [Planctomycetota bacterium]